MGDGVEDLTCQSYISLDFLFKVTIFFFNFGLQLIKSNNFLRFPIYSNNFCMLWLKCGFEVSISLDFQYTVMIFANFGLKVTNFLRFPA